MVSLNEIEWQREYPMDFYSNDSLGNWTVNNKLNRAAPATARQKIKIEYETSAPTQQQQQATSVTHELNSK